MAPDLTPLERAAERAGLAGLHARVVPPDARRGTWFHWDLHAGELLVSERVLERCPPADACALLVDEILLARRVGDLRRRALWGVLGVAVAVTAAVALTAGGGRPSQALGIGLTILFPLLLLMIWLAARTRAALAADDETVALLGDAERLTRGLNRMDQDEVVVGSWRAPARPDLHRRAERLARLHGLCAETEPPSAGG